jgi:hypothetical protein
MARKLQRNDYAELAAVLSPHDLDAGARQVDEAILSSLRFRANQRNIRMLCEWSGAFLGAFGALFYFLPIAAEAIGDGAALIPPVHPYFGAVLALVGAALLLIGFRLRNAENAEGGLPADVAEWVANSDSERSFRNWHEIYWPQWKRDANRTRIGKFTFWRRQLIEERREATHDWAETIADRR